MVAVAVLGLIAGCGGGFAAESAIEDDLRQRVVDEGVEAGLSVGEATCTTTDEAAGRRNYECQVPVFSVRPEADRLIRFDVVADADGGWEATRTGVVTFR